MLSRLFWVGIAGVALVTGMILQGGDEMFHWGGGDRAIDATIDRVVDGGAIDSGIDRAVDGSFDRMQIVSDGRKIDVPPETKRAMAEAVGRLVKAQADLAILKVRDAGEEEMQAATARRDQARADVDRLKAEIEGLEQAAAVEQDAVRAQVRQEVRDEIRDTVREAVRN